MTQAGLAKEVKTRPILFRPELVRAIMDGVKTETRRVVKWKAREDGLNLSASSLSVGFYCTGMPSSGYVLSSRDGRGVWNDRTYPLHCPYGEPGDRLWVREMWGDVTLAFRSHECEEPRVWAYKADEAVHNSGGFLEHMRDSGIVCRRWRPSIHMPRWMSRLTLEIASVRVERLQQLTDEGARAEGVDYMPSMPAALSHRTAFAKGWDKINGPRGFGWDVNPFVWVLSFKTVNA